MLGYFSVYAKQLLSFKVSKGLPIKKHNFEMSPRYFLSIEHMGKSGVSDSVSVGSDIWAQFVHFLLRFALVKYIQ